MYVHVQTCLLRVRVLDSLTLALILLCISISILFYCGLFSAFLLWFTFPDDVDDDVSSNVVACVMLGEARLSGKVLSANREI